ncbi:MAG TPA: VOC family protein [Acidimicrobiales bacterium]
MATGHAALTGLTVGDDPAGWSAAGFAVDAGGTCRVGGVRIALAGAGGGRGLLGWTLAGCPLPPGDVDGVATAADPGADVPHPDEATGDAAAAHPNGVTAIDHVVLVTPDLDRTTAALADLGLEPRRTREAGRGRLQRFFRLREVILEVVGPASPAGDGPAALWGLAFTVADIDATAAHLGDRVGDPRPAVQPGRRIATLRAGPAVSVPVAFMSPDPRVAPRGAAGRRL